MPTLHKKWATANQIFSQHFNVPNGEKIPLTFKTDKLVDRKILRCTDDYAVAYEISSTLTFNISTFRDREYKVVFILMLPNGKTELIYDLTLTASTEVSARWAVKDLRRKGGFEQKIADELSLNLNRIYKYIELKDNEYALGTQNKENFNTAVSFFRFHKLLTETMDKHLYNEVKQLLNSLNISY